MQQFTYEQQEKLVENQIKPKNMLFIIGAVIGIIILAIIIVNIIIAIAKGNTCKNMYEELEESTLDYLADRQIVLNPLSPTTTVTVEELLSKGYLNHAIFTIDDMTCGGEVKVTRVNDEYIFTPNLTNCSYCTTEGTWSEPSEKLPNKDIIDVIVTYNYVEKTTNYTTWTAYYTPEKLETDPITDPTDDRFDVISSDAKNIEIEIDEKSYYKYRDLEWKFYANAGADYSGFSSTQPAGYEKKDTSTTIQTEWTEWSVSAPSVEDYRSIEEKTGYRFYYEEDGVKHYYNSGAYLPEAPDDIYIEYDKNDQSRIFRYRDNLWRWYNGDARKYSSYMSEPTNTYLYKDEEIERYSSYSSWDEESSITPENDYYREEIIEVRKRFRLKYDMYSFNKLNEYVSEEQFSQQSGMTIEEVYNRDDLELVLKYEYIYRK